MSRHKGVAIVTLAMAAMLSSAHAVAAQSGGTAEDAAIAVRVELAARLVTLPGSPSFTAKGKGELHYSLRGSSAAIKGETIPRLVYEAENPPAGLDRLTVIAEGIAGTTPVADWKNYPTVVLKPVDLRVRAYGKAASEITEATPALVDVVLSDLALSTEMIVVEGWEVSGYMDSERLEAQLVGKAVLPDAPYPPYKEWLSGKPIALELLIAMENFFEKPRK